MRWSLVGGMLALCAVFDLQAKDFSLGVPEARTALLMEELEESLKDMMGIDSALNQILYGRCQSQWAAVADRNSKSNRSRFSDCFAEAAPASYDLQSRKIGSYDHALAVYSRSLERYAQSKDLMVARDDDFSSGLRATLSATQVDRDTALTRLGTLRTEVLSALERLKTERANILGRVIDIRGEHEVFRHGVRRVLNEGDEIQLLDRIETGFKGWIKIQLYDAERYENHKATLLTFGENTSVNLTDWVISSDNIKAKIDAIRKRSAAVELLKGVIRFFAPPVYGESSFSIRSGGSICGIRGTEVDAIYDPEQRSTLYRLHSGTVEIQPHSTARSA